MSMRVATMVSNALAICGKTQAQIAEEAEFPNASMINMIKTGKSKLPPTKAPALAKALGIDPKELIILSFAEKWPGTEDLIRQLAAR